MRSMELVGRERMEVAVSIAIIHRIAHSMLTSAATTFNLGRSLR